jgi:hypothetical protein
MAVVGRVEQRREPQRHTGGAGRGNGQLTRLLMNASRMHVCMPRA